MTWTFANPTWTKSGASREVITFASAIPNPGQVTVRSETIAHELSIPIRMDPDGRTCLEVAIVGADLVLRPRRFNKPQAALATAPHGISVGRPFSLRVRLDGTLVVGIVIREDGSTVEVQADVLERASVIPWGVASAVDGATAQDITTGGTAPQFTTVNEVIYWLQGGNLYAIYTDLTVELVYPNLFAPDDTVQTDNVDGVAIFVGSGKSRKVNMVTRAGGLWTATSGSLPGATGPGTTTATLITILAGSVVLAGMPEQPLALYGSASGEIDTWDLADLTEGHAWIRTSGDSSTIGDPILCLAPGSNGSLFVGCTNSVNYMLGNPYEGTDRIITRSYTFGVSGPNAAVMIGTPGGGDAIAMHAPHGLMLAPLGGAPIPVSLDTLTEHIAFDVAERAGVRVTLAPDPERRMLHCFVTGPGRSVYVSYAEFIGGYAQGGRGYFPITLPVEPTCAKIWKGSVILGTKDGRLVKFDAASGTEGTELGQPLTGKISSHLLHAGPIESDTILRRFTALMSRNSATCEVRIYGGATPEDAYADRQLLAGPRPMGPSTWAWSCHARSPAMVAEFTFSGLVTIEAIDIEASSALLTRRTPKRTPPAIPGPCKPASVPPAPPTPTTPTETGDGDGGTLPDGNPNPTDPTTEPMVVPYPPIADPRMSQPFDEPFQDFFDANGFGGGIDKFDVDDSGIDSGSVGEGPTWWLEYGDPLPGGGNGGSWNRRGYRDWDRLPSRFGGTLKYDSLKPSVFIPTVPGGTGRIIVEAPGFFPYIPDQFGA